MNERLKDFLKSILCLVIMYPALVVLAHAQVSEASVCGRVSDQTGAIVVNATVIVRNVDTGQARTSRTNNQGDYIINQLPPGVYELSVAAPSFSKVIIKNINLSVGARQTLNVELRPGTVTETVEVTNTPYLIETSRSEIARVVTPVEVQSLPLLNRTFASLAVITPEARPAGNFDPVKNRVGNITFSGGDGRQININVDGGDNKDNILGGFLQNFAYESIQEFQVLPNGWTAESGRAVGGIINAVTKSGTNITHGSLFANFRDEALRAKSFFERRDDRTKPDFSRQEFGGSISGPLIPNKFFFFGALERYRERQSIFTPTAVLTQLSAVPGSQPSEVIPAPYDDMLLTARLDQRFGASQTLFYRYSQQTNRSTNDQINDPANTDAAGGNTDSNRAYSLVVNYTRLLSPTTLNQWVFHFQYFKNQILRTSDLPTLTFPGNIQVGANVNMPQETLERKYQVRDDLSIQRGEHSIKLGLNYIYTQLGGFYYSSKGYQLTFFDSPLTIKNNTNGRYPQGFSTPGAVRTLTYSEGDATHAQDFHQLALYLQDDYKINPRLTLNLGLRWDANIGLLIDQTNNRTIKILSQIDDPRAKAITGDAAALKKRTPSWLEFQPRFGIAIDPVGSGRMVIRGGYGIFYDQIFQNLTFFSLQQTRQEIFQSMLLLTNSNVGVGDPFLRTFRYGIDPLPSPPPGGESDLVRGAFGRINDPNIRDPYVQKFSIGFQTMLGREMSLSSDYVHMIGIHEPRVLVINPQIQPICNPAFPGARPTSSLCVREATGGISRLFDRAFKDAGLDVNRLGQINMIGTTNRSLYDGWTTQFRIRTGGTLFSVSYVLSSSRSWGGQPVASYNGNSIAITPEQQFRPEEFGATRFDERHRLVASAVFDLPYGLRLAPIIQAASARPYSPTTGLDTDGDGLAVNDRLCSGVSPASVFNVRGNSAAVLALNPSGCTQARVNSMRVGFVLDSQGKLRVLSGRYFTSDIRVTKSFGLGERFKITSYVDVYNVFNVVSLSFAERRSVSPATSSDFFLQPFSLYGSGFGQSIGRPRTLQLGFRLSF
jgi:hypothetical protein